MSVLPLGILASSGGAPAFYELISTATPSGVSTVTFSSIAATYKHLQFRIVANNATGFSGLSFRFNSDTSTNYTRHYVNGDGSSVTSFGQSSQDKSLVGIAGSGTTNIFASTILDILDYGNTNKNKTIRSMTGLAQSGANSLYLYSGAWLSTSAITSVTVYDNSGNNFVTGSRISLYGIKG